MTENVHHLDPNDAQVGTEALKADLLAETAGAGLSKNAAAKQIGLSGSTLSQWLNDTYPGDVPAVERKIAIWLQTRREAQRRSFAAAGLDSHRELAVTDQVMTALSHAQAVGDVVLVHGQSGAGKSWAAQHYCRTHSSAHYVSMTCAVRGLPGLLGRVGVAVGVGATHGSALDAESAIIARLQDRGALLVVDEAHHLTAKLLDELRCIRDVAGCGLALIGDDSVRMTLARCPQIVGRIGFRVGIPLPSEDGRGLRTRPRAFSAAARASARSRHRSPWRRGTWRDACAPPAPGPRVAAGAGRRPRADRGRGPGNRGRRGDRCVTRLTPGQRGLLMLLAASPRSSGRAVVRHRRTRRRPWPRPSGVWQEARSGDPRSAASAFAVHLGHEMAPHADAGREAVGS